MLKIDLALSILSIALPFGHHFEGYQIDTVMNLCAIFSVNTCMYKDNYQYVKVLLGLNLPDTKISHCLMIG